MNDRRDIQVGRTFDIYAVEMGCSRCEPCGIEGERLGMMREEEFAREVEVLDPKLPNQGEKKVVVKTANGALRRMVYQMAEVTRPLTAASKVCDAGHEIRLRKDGGEVVDLRTGERTTVKRVNNVYVMELWVKAGDFHRQDA